MIDREKVIKGLGETLRVLGNHVPERYLGYSAGACLDAIALLEAQESRVMTLEEVLDMKFDDVVYFQVYPTNAVLSAIVIDVIPKLSEINVGVVQFRFGAGYNGINNADLSYYGKTWRCWTSRPTEEQREAASWR